MIRCAEQYLFSIADHALMAARCWQLLLAPQQTMIEPVTRKI